jgi:mRNA interferase MazF
VAAAGDYGKPRLAVVVQANVLNEADPPSVIVALMTGTVREAPFLRLTLSPTPENGLPKPSQIMVDKLAAIRPDKITSPVGRLTGQQLLALNRLLALVIGLA